MYKQVLAILLSVTLLTISFFCWHPQQVGQFIRKTTKFGDKYLHRQSQQSEQVVLQYLASPDKDEQAFKQTLTTILSLKNSTTKQKQFMQCNKGNKSQFFKFTAYPVGIVGNKSLYQTIQLQRRSDDCFKHVIVSFTNQKHNMVNNIEIQIFTGQRTKQFCTQAYIFATGAKLHLHSFVLRNHHKFTWKNMNQIEYNNVVNWGIHIFRMCDSIQHWFPDVIKTAELFVGGLGTNPKIPFFGSRPTQYMERLSVDFINAGTGFQWKKREPIFMNLTKDEVKPGDFLAITRFDGLDQIIQYGAGSHSGHSAVVLEVDGVLSVVESQDAWYWPKHNIQRNDWQTWKKWALNAGFNVAVLPLTEQSRSKLNLTKAQQFFKKMQGYPYGYHNFLFGWIDTPFDNFPPILHPDYLIAIFSYLQRMFQAPIKKIFTQALNKRMNTTDRKIDQIVYLMAKNNMTTGELLSIVEKDGWWYSDGPSYVCSSFVAAVYKAGGLLFDSIQTTEMTPKDVYTLTIYNRNFQVPEKCKKNDPSLPYCQIMGKYLMQLPGYSTIQQYPHMCQKCPSLTPDFKRTDGC